LVGETFRQAIRRANIERNEDHFLKALKSDSRAHEKISSGYYQYRQNSDLKCDTKGPDEKQPIPFNLHEAT